LLVYPGIAVWYISTVQTKPKICFLLTVGCVGELSRKDDAVGSSVLKIDAAGIGDADAKSFTGGI
jgi:hypothetical protein